MEEEEGAVGIGVNVSADGVENEIDDRVGEEGDNEAEEGVEDSVFRVGNFLIVAAGEDVADTTPNQHDDGDETDNIEDDVSELVNDAVGTDEVGGHAVGAGGFGAFLDREGNGFTGAKRCGDADAGDEL